MEIRDPIVLRFTMHLSATLVPRQQDRGLARMRPLANEPLPEWEGDRAPVPGGGLKPKMTEVEAQLTNGGPRIGDTNVETSTIIAPSVSLAAGALSPAWAAKEEHRLLDQAANRAVRPLEGSARGGAFGSMNSAAPRGK